MRQAMSLTSNVERAGIVMHVRINAKPAHYSGDRWSLKKWKLLRDWMEPAFRNIEGNTGVIVAWGQEHLQAFFEFDTAAAVDTAIALHELTLNTRPGAQHPIQLAVAVTRGEVELARWQPSKSGREGMTSAPHGMLGDAVARARRLADAAVPGALLIDASALQDISLGYLNSRVGRQRGWGGHDYLAPVRELRNDPDELPTVYYELKWSGEELMAPPEVGSTTPGSVRRRGALSNWISPDQASIEGEDGEIFWTTRHHLVGEPEIEAGQRVYFVAAPNRPTGRPRTAGAVLALGAVVTGKVVKVFESRRYAFVKVLDREGVEQEIFLHADDNEWPLTVGDPVRFTVGENVRGAVAVGARVLDAELVDGLIENLSDLTEHTGNVVKGSGVPTFELFYEALNSMEWSLTDEGELSLPHILMNPGMMEKLLEWTPEQEAAMDDLRRRKKEELLARRRRQRLS
jgi:hypothetical protein